MDLTAVPQHPFRPKSIICFREGYDRERILGEVVAGVTVAFIAFPLAMALAIASGVKPEQGLYTAVIAGFLISALGGSRVQIGGPTGAFVVIVFDIVRRHGTEGLTLATLMAGVILVILGLARFGAVIKFVPYPVTTGFTTGIALLIFSQQITELVGLELAEAPSEFVERWIAYAKAAHTLTPATTAVGLASLGLLFFLRRVMPRAPGAIITLALATAAVAVLGLDERFGVATIDSRFGGIPRSLPAPSLPALDLETFNRARALVPEATTIALLAAIESLLCAVVADGMIDDRHDSNQELLAQGAANIGAALFGGIPATGAIARTATNIRNGARTPVAGIIHAFVLLVIVLAAAPLAKNIPLAV
ncbi:MAG: SulP family inorganic anion transporter, partial [Candidatus Binatia bacterium]